MPYWSLVTEITALLLIFVLMFSLAVYKKTVTHTLKLYKGCLALSACCILWNMLCVTLLRYGNRIPVGVNLFTNSLYFWLTVVMCSATALYIFEKMLEHVYDPYCILRVKRMLFVLIIFYTLIVIVNLKTGVLFWFDEAGKYHRGFLNSIGYGIVLLELLFMFICLFKYRSSVGKEMKHTFKMFPSIVVALIFIQVFNPEILLNGLIVAFVDVILFVSFFGQRRENDSVTGAGNRDGLFKELALRIGVRQKFQILLVVPKDFRVINQRHGHEMGNEFLYSIAAWMEETYKEAAIFRYIGVSFAVVLPYRNQQQSEKYVQEFQKRFNETWKVGPNEEVLVSSFSDVIYEGEDLRENQIMEFLDYMLSFTKRSRQRYIHFDDVFADRFLRRRIITELLRKTAKEQVFETWYQPVYFSGEERCFSAEALVRMKDDKGRFIPLDEFIPIAEEIGVVNDIFWQVLEQVCRLIKTYPKLPVESVSVNMSVAQFEEPELVQKINKLFKKWGIEPKKVKFEITERVIAFDAVQVKNIIRDMEEYGFRFYLDDFGTGYSNFASVVQYHFECIKLDKSLIHIVEEDKKGHDMVRGLIRLFHEMGLVVVAEGTETKEQANMLLELGADRIQGFYYAKPMPENELLDFME